MTSTRSCATFRLLALASLATAASAQCTYSWPASFNGGASSGVLSGAIYANGSVYAGRFTTIGGVAANRIALWDGSTFSALGTGTNGDVNEVLVLADGTLVAGGTFGSAGGNTVNCLARWNGSTWSGFGNGVDALAPFGANVQALAQLQNGDLVVGGNFAGVSGTAAANIARWNGTSWSALGTGINGSVRDLAVLPNGDLIATGSFTNAGGVAAASIARWNGTSWSALGTGLGVFGGSALCVLANGDLVVGGSFLTAGGVACNRIARWNGAWSALGTGTNAVVSSLLALPNGDVMAGGLFTTAGGLAANRLARWNGSAWSAFPTGLDAAVHEIVQDGTGAVVVGGDFTLANGSAAGNLARLVSSCGPSAASLGAGCVGSGGLNTLTAARLPVVGGAFRGVGTGMPTLGFVLVATGFTSTSLPLFPLLPQALPGCTLYASPDVVDVAVPAAGAVASTLAFPNNPALVGASFFHQYVPMELDLAANITAFTSSNALQVTVGTF
ncbi:MAG: hypothetical protein JNK15_01345 [Planctomycetes bacterium]|nr:hypothetical protein [Planctomycetota bacterium]